MTSNYRRYIRQCGVNSRPLIGFLKKDRFQWTSKADEAFGKLKDSVTSALVLALPNNLFMFVVETDTCDYSSGVVLMQEIYPITYLRKGVSGSHHAF